jgi:excisionase family DNA binding protein
MTATHHDPGDELPRLLNITDLADHLGVNVRHIRRLVHERRIPFIKWGHLIRFDPRDVRTWLEANRQTRPPIAPVPSLQRRRPAQAEPPDSLSGQLPLAP